MEIDFYNWFLVFVRLGAFLLAFAISHLDLLTLFGLLAREIAIGLLFGFFARMVFFATDIAGVIIANEIGLSMGSIMDPTSRQPEQVPGLILFFLATITMLSLVLHHGLLLGFAK